MVLRKITIDNSVKYVPITEKDIKQSDKIQPILAGGKSNTRKQNKNCSKNKKKFLINVAVSGFGYLTKNTCIILFE